MRHLAYIFLLCAVCLTLVTPLTGMASLKSAKQAEKLAADFSKLDQAREKVKEALADSTDNDRAYTLYVAGKVEAAAFRHYQKLLGINRSDPNVDRASMGDALLSALSYYEQALSLDTTVNKKGKQQTRFSRSIAEWLNSVVPSLYNSGVAYMNKRLYYPQAYNAFKAYAQAPGKYYYKQVDETVINDSVQSVAWFYAGVMAYNARQFTPAAEAFGLARARGYSKKEAWLNEMSCLTQLVKADSTLTDSLSLRLTRLSADGYNRFGLATPLFIKKYVAGLLYESRLDSALNVVDSALSGAADNGMLHSMRAALLQTMNRHQEAAQEYLVAAADTNAELTTLKEGSRAIAAYGIELLDQVKGTRRAAREQREKIRAEFLSPALAIAKRAQALAPDDADIANTILTIDYHLH